MRIAMGIPVEGGGHDRRTDLLPGLERSTLERQGAERLPLWLYQVEVGGLEHELPA
jgi:hypothetical protein